MIHSFPFPLIEVDREGLVQAQNASFAKLFEITDQQLLNRPLEKLFEFTRNVHFNFNTFNSFDLTQPTALSAQLILPIKLTRISVILSVMPAPGDESCFWITVSERPDELTSTTGQLDQMQSFKTAAKSAGIGIWQYDVEQNIGMFSEEFKVMLGLSRYHPLTWEEFIGLVYQDDIDIIDVFISNHIEFGIPLNFEFRVVVDEQVNWFSIRGEALTANDGTTSLMGSLMDCTYEKEVLVQLNNAVEGKKLALSAGNIGTWQGILGDDKEWLWNWDKLANDMFRLDADDIGDLSKWVNRLHPEDLDRVRSTLLESLKEGGDFEQEYRVVLPDNELRYVFAKGLAGRDSNGQIIRIDGVCIDRTAHYLNQIKLKELNTKLEARVRERTEQANSAKEQAEKASQAKSDFLAMMSHELRTPMNAIVGSLELLELSKQTDESRDLISTAKTSANNLVAILNDILDLNKVEAGKLELDIKPFSISKTIDNVINIFLPVSDKKRILLDVREDPQLPKFIDGDSIRVRQILFNILGNAIKFTDSQSDKVGKVVLDASVESQCENVINIRFSIKDNGIGIAPEIQDKLFSPFTQAERSTSRKYGGTGLGLTICAKLTDMMGGSIELHSEKGKGSEFVVTLPFWLSQAKSQQEEVELGPLAGESIVIISCSRFMDKVGHRFFSYLEAENAVCEYIDSTNFKADLMTAANKARLSGLTLVLAGEDSPAQDLLSQLIFNLEKPESCVIAIERSQLRTTRQTFSRCQHMAIKPISRYQLIQFLEQSITSRDNDLPEELDIELELEFEPSLDSITPQSSAEELLKSGVLLVEDNPFNRKLMVKQLRNLGYACELAEDGVEGLNAWQNNDYKIILTDCHMPNLDGYEMTKQIRRKEQHSNAERIPIVAITGAAMSGDEERCLSVGIDAFISKPVSLKDLQTALDSWYE